MYPISPCGLRQSRRKTSYPLGSCALRAPNCRTARLFAEWCQMDYHNQTTCVVRNSNRFSCCEILEIPQINTRTNSSLSRCSVETDKPEKVRFHQESKSVTFPRQRRRQLNVLRTGRFRSRHEVTRRVTRCYIVGHRIANLVLRLAMVRRG